MLRVGPKGKTKTVSVAIRSLLMMALLKYDLRHYEVRGCGEFTEVALLQQLPPPTFLNLKGLFFRKAMGNYESNKRVSNSP